MSSVPHVSSIEIPTKRDFDEFKEKCLGTDGWNEVYKDDKMTITSKKTEDSDLEVVRAKIVFDDINVETLYDVLHDHEYRVVWDTSMIEGRVIQMLQNNCEIGYYAAKMPGVLVSNRDFCNLRTWTIDGDEYIIFNYSVKHDDCPEKKNFIRAQSICSGYYIRRLEVGCEFIYYSQSDPKGWIPIKLINYIMTRFAPRVLNKLHDVTVNYNEWKSKNNPDYKPWLEI